MKKIIILFLLWRLFLFIVAGASPVFIQPFGARFPYYQERLIDTGLPHFIWSFGNFDGVHYLGIAKDAYAAQYTQAFFPLYPIIIKSVSFVTLGNLLLSALIISNATFLAALLIFYKLIAKTHNPNVAFWSVLFLLAFPTSFYFGAVYTESLFFLLIISAFYLAEKGKVWQAALLGAFASGTRLVGVFLAPALLFKRDKRHIFPLLLIPLGLVSYMIFLQVKFNNPFYFLTSQSVFGQERLSNGIVLLPQVFFRYFKILTTTSGSPLLSASFELLATLWALVALFLAYKKVKLEWLIFSLLIVLLPTFSGTLASMPRYILIAFPLYLVPAYIKDPKIKIAILAVSFVLLAVSTAFFAQGYWVA
ncbi:MAG: mannosyltransferase family protein [Candidatus Curtissbacteria bacterium]